MEALGGVETRGVYAAGAPDMGVTVQKKGKMTVVSFDGHCTVAEAVEMKAAVLDAMGSASRVTLDMESVKDADLALLQILCAAHMEAKKRSVAFGCGTLSPAVVNTIEELGYQRSMPCLSGECCAFVPSQKDERRS